MGVRGQEKKKRNVDLLKEYSEELFWASVDEVIGIILRPSLEGTRQESNYFIHCK